MKQKSTLEIKVKDDRKSNEKEAKRDAKLARENEGYRKLLTKCKQRNQKILTRDNKLIKNIEALRKGYEVFQKKKLKSHHNESKAKYDTKIKTTSKNLSEQEQKHVQ